MRIQWCWRCKQDVPMLDEQEYQEVSEVYRGCVLATKEFRKKWGLSLEQANLEERFRPVRTWYEQRTGMADCNENAVMHHRLSLLGDPCTSCGKPLRTPQARLCGHCGAGRIKSARPGVEFSE